MIDLMPHQWTGINWLVCTHGVGLLAWEPGCAKTLTALCAVKKLECRRILVVAPVSIMSVWQDELAKWFDGAQAIEIKGMKAKRAERWARLADKTKAGIYLVGYETLRVDRELAMEADPDAMILDETLKIQNHAAKITRIILAMRPPVRIALNGTPISNGYADLWPVMTWLDPQSLYGNFYRFRAIHAVMNPYFPQIVGWRDVEGIKKRTDPLIMRVKKTDVLKDLPPCTEQTIRFELNAKEKKIYESIKKELSVKIKGTDMPISNALVELVRLRQAAGGLYSFGDLETPSSKVGALLDAIGPISRERKVLVFTGFVESANYIKNVFGNDAVQVTGETSSLERTARIGEWKKPTGPQVLVGTDAIGMGLNLQEASYVIFFDLPYSFAKYEQRVGRAWRKGQKSNVTVYTLIAEHTVDEKIQKVLGRKVKMASEFAGWSRRDVEEMLE